jgi:hypothetical protein
MEKTIPSINKHFQPTENELSGCIYMAGECCRAPSFLHKVLYRCSNSGYNVEAGYFAAMNMMDKRVRFENLQT